MINLNKQREGFSLMMAVFVILFVATIGASVLNMSGKMVGETIIQHKKEQAILYAKSYTELAILAATSRDCVKTLTGTEGAGTRNEYRINAIITYIGNDVNTLPGCGGAFSIGGPVLHTESKSNAVIVDVFVDYTDPFSSNNKPIRYFRRTIQKL